MLKQMFGRMTETPSENKPTMARTHSSASVAERPLVRGLHSSTFQLNVSTFCPMWWSALLVSVTKNGSG